MKKLLLFIMAPFVFLASSKAGEGEGYAVNKIPAALLKNADAVKRMEDIRFEVVSKEKAIYYHKVAYTVLNENGDRYAQCLEYYDKLQSVDYIEGTLFNADGKKIKSLKKSDIQDRSGTDNNSLADDNRIKYHNFYWKSYPYTVEYEVVLKYHYTMFYPGWLPLENENLAVQSSKMAVMLPEGIDFRYRAFNINNDPVVTKTKTGKTYTWEISDYPAIQIENKAPHWYEIAPVVCMGPVQFAVEGYEGNMSSWRDFGKFVHALKAGRDHLPDNIKSTVHSLTDGLQDPREKIRVLYNFLQKNTRYISIQLGLGGWQPFNAEYVATKRYGDCKALTNYMCALLKEAGIKSNYTLVKAGEGKNFFVSDFPSSQFNHAILSVPLQNDTIWLECTSQTLPAGYLSGFTSDRPVLMVDENGGTLVRTPKYGIKDNLQLRKITADIDAEGNLTTNISTRYKALQEDGVHSIINAYSKDKVLEYLKTEIDLPSYDVTSFDYKEEASTLPSVLETLSLNAGRYAQVSGKRLFVPYNIMSRQNSKLVPDPDRKFDIDLTYEYTDIDSVEIKVPSGFQPESVPQDVNIESAFGRYSASVRFTNDKIIYYRKMEQFGGRFPANKYNDLVKFYDQIYKADRNKVVLVKQ